MTTSTKRLISVKNFVPIGLPSFDCGARFSNPQSVCKPLRDFQTFGQMRCDSPAKTKKFKNRIEAPFENSETPLLKPPLKPFSSPFEKPSLLKPPFKPLLKIEFENSGQALLKPPSRGLQLVQLIQFHLQKFRWTIPEWLKPAAGSALRLANPPPVPAS